MWFMRSWRSAKIEIGSSLPLDRELSIEIRGLDSISGVARKLSEMERLKRLQQLERHQEGSFRLISALSYT
jgi:hypothetical protein